MAETRIGLMWITCAHVKWEDNSPNWRISKDGVGYDHGYVQDPFILQIGEEDNGDPRMLLLCEFCSARVEAVIVKELAARACCEATAARRC